MAYAAPPRMAAPQRQQELQRFFPQFRRMMQSPVAAAILNQTLGGIAPPTQSTPFGPVGGLLDRRAGVPPPGQLPGLTWQALAGMRGRGGGPMVVPPQGLPAAGPGLLGAGAYPMQQQPINPFLPTRPPLANAGRALSRADREYIEALAASRKVTPGRLFDLLFSNEPVMWRKPEAWVEQ